MLSHTSKVILLNAPPRAGKDTFFRFISDDLKYNCNIQRYAFADVLRETAEILFDLTHSETLQFNSTLKDVPHDRFYGKTYREVLKYISEEMKKKFSPSFFADRFITVMKNSPNVNFVVTDLGFDIEFNKIQNYKDWKDIYLIKIERDDCTFENDSRDYISEHLLSILPKENIYNIKNTGDTKYSKKVNKIVEEIFNDD